MQYILKSTSDKDWGNQILLEELVNSELKITISSLSNDWSEEEKSLVISKEDLHRFIGALLHVQSNIKNSKNV